MTDKKTTKKRATKKRVAKEPSPPKRKQVSFFHSGDLGDIIYAIPVAREVCRKEDADGVFVLGDRPFTKAIVPRIPLIERLLEVCGFEVRQGESADYDIAGFRRFHSRTRTLVEAQWMHVREQIDIPFPSLDRWIPDTPAEEPRHFNIVVARSARYNSPDFPWRALVEMWGDDMFFVGLPEEHETFCLNFGSIRMKQTAHLDEVRRAISDADLFIGNQSSPAAIAIGMGKESLIECSPVQPDCVYYPGPFTYATGPIIDWRGERFVQKINVAKTVSDTMVPPDGGWTDPDTGFQAHSLSAVAARRAKETGAPLMDCREQVMEHTVSLHPKFFLRPGNGQALVDQLVDAAKKRLQVESV